MTDLKVGDTVRVRDLPPTSEPFTRCGYACRYVLLDGREVQPTDAEDLGLCIRVTAQSPVGHERFHAMFPAVVFRAMGDDEFMRTIAAMAWQQQQQHGNANEADPCGQTHRLGPQEPCVWRKGHGWRHESANGAIWETDGPTWTYPWPLDHRLHPAKRMRCAEEATDG